MVISRSLARSLVYRVPGECERCPACGSERIYELDLLTLRHAVGGRKTGFVSGCDECGLAFTNPQPSAEALAHLYSPEGEWGARRRDVEPAADADRHKPQGTSWARMFDVIRDALPVTSPPAGAAVLDFGCGPGKLLDALQDSGWATFGIEPAMDHPFRRHRRLERIPDEPAFDLIVANHVLEHIPNPLGLLRQLAAAARPGGFLLVTVPRLDTLPVHGDYKYVISGHVHITAYTWPCLHTLLARAGWNPVVPPPEEIPKGGGRHTRSRLRVVARRAEGAVAAPFEPSRAARDAFREYYATRDRTLLERAGFYRLAARQAESRRRHARHAAKVRAAAAVSH